MTTSDSTSEITLSISGKLLQRLQATLEFDRTLEEHALQLLSDGLASYEIDCFGYPQDGE